MKYGIISTFLVIMLFLAICPVVSAGTEKETGSVDTTTEFIDKIQNSIVKMLKPPAYEISIHAMLDTGETRRIASTTLKKKGTPSEPEDVEAILLNKVIFIHEGDMYDITTPLHDENGDPFAVTGIKVRLIPSKVSKEDAKAIARDLSDRIEKEILSSF